MPNHYYEQIEKRNHEITLVRESRGEVMIHLNRRPHDKELQKQLANLDADIERRSAELSRLQDAATALEKADKKEAEQTRKDRIAAAGNALTEVLKALQGDAAAFDAWIVDGLKILTSYDSHATAAMRAGREVGIRGAALQYLLDPSPLGVRLADQLARNGWSRLPFIDITHPRNTATCAQMVEHRCEKLRGHIRYMQADAETATKPEASAADKKALQK